ncbi:two-component system, NtrC family, sensor histidine kinase HydH [Methylacidimicrobium cyclopophantes]|uniref:histidine kinase n=1 Tax=Methylacidimicrobium cyclopophantes TaxID=1041766 RepID=A0A5E6MB10_9BACT|nr:ATP-binding protein [Methylacidimicrobium cyclopophantes]VVM05509.1 two-component system, NtrC family, sensor histidine kinase HydH [Methylacidimicrobium cyclopophantes]
MALAVSLRNSFLNKLLGRIERLGPAEIQNYLRRLAQEKGFLETVFNALQEGILVVDIRGKVLYGNQSAERLLGIDWNAALGKSIARYLPDVDWPSLFVSGQIVSRDLQISYPEVRYLNCSAVPLEKGPEGTEAFVVIIYDMTANREKTLEMIESEKLNALTLLAAGVAHELGNPLNSLQIHTELLQRELAGKKTRAEVVDSLAAIRSELQRLDVIVNQFLRAIRPSPPKLAWAALNEIVRDAVEFLTPQMENRDVLIEMELAKGMPMVRADRDQLRQAFFNVMKNALEAMDRGGILEVRTELSDSHFLVVFRDNGSGMSATEMGRAFEPYFTTKQSGTGLGLLVVRRIVREHGGEIQLESREGKGTTVRILLPRSERRVRLLPMGSEQMVGDGKGEAKC